MPLSTVLFAAALFLLAGWSQACSCLPYSVESTYYSDSVQSFIKGKVVKEISPCARGGLAGANSCDPFKDQDRQYTYLVRIFGVFKGCWPRPYGLRRIAILESPVGSSLCGIRLRVGAVYALPIFNSTGTSFIGSCQFVREYKNLPPADRKFLETRHRCCGRTCKCIDKNLSYDSCNNGKCLPSDKKPCPEATKCIPSRCEDCKPQWFNKYGLPACKS